MAIKEGRCTNCGSILFLDSAMPKGHCFFCDAVFDNEEAFRAHEHPEEFTFPNEEQPKYEGPSLTPASMQRVAAPQPRPAARQLEEEDAYTPPAAKVPSLKIPMKATALIVGISLLIVGIFVGITLPMTMKRDKQQTAIVDRFAGELPVAVDKAKDIAVHNLNSSTVYLVLPQPLTADEAMGLFDSFCQIRSDVLALKDNSFEATRKPVTFRVVTPQGGYLIKNPADQAALESGLVILD